MITKTLIAGTAGLALAMPMTPALAGGSDDRVEVSTAGQCSATAGWELEVKERDGGVEVEFEVDSNVVGQVWDYTLTGPGGVLSQGTRTTTAPSGSFSVEVNTSGSATDVFTGVASHAGQICDSSAGGGPGEGPGDDDGPGDDNPGDDNPGDDSPGDEAGDDNGGSSNDDRPGDDNGGKRSRESFDGTCTAGSEITLKVKRSAVFRIAELEVDSDVKAQKWRYEIKRGDKTIASGNARTKGRSGSFSVKAKAKGKGKLTASASRTSGAEDCSID